MCDVRERVTLATIMKKDVFDHNFWTKALSVTKPYSLQWFYRKRLVIKVYYTCTWLNMINFIVKDYVLRTRTEQCSIESQYLETLEKKHERSV